ncbi:MAG: hypothetical protein U9Q15_03085 [Patescibacteria group bacterium]|nr:hypothetical protein [Patescibacteria group bacterium]
MFVYVLMLLFILIMLITTFTILFRQYMHVSSFIVDVYEQTVSQDISLEGDVIGEYQDDVFDISDYTFSQLVWDTNTSAVYPQDLVLYS